MQDQLDQRRPRMSSGTTAAILAAAESEFAAHGLDGARMERIAQNAGATRQLIHHYFGSKELLYSHVLTSISKHPDHDRVLIDYDAMAPEAAIRSLFGGLFDIYREHPALARLSALDQSPQDARHVTSRNRIRSYVPDLIQQLDRILKRGAEAGVFAADLCPGGVFSAGVSVMVGYFFNRTLLSLVDGDGGDPDPSPPAEEVWRAYGLDFVLRAIRAPCDPRPGEA